MLNLTAEIVSADVSNNRVQPAELTRWISDVHRALRSLGLDLGRARHAGIAEGYAYRGQALDQARSPHLISCEDVKRKHGDVGPPISAFALSGISQP